MSAMTLSDFLRLAKQYTDLGWSVQEQLQDVATGESLDEQNPNALEMCADILRDLADFDMTDADDLAGEISEYLDCKNEESDQ
jgi:hypothetical protein